MDAVRHQLLFERFLSAQRSGPPDIDIDIEAERREEVIQHVYETYGRDRAAQVANAISYRPRSAVRDAARALGYPSGVAAAWSKSAGQYRRRMGWRDEVVDSQEDSENDTTAHHQNDEEIPVLVEKVASALNRLPRHMGIHSGGMVLTDEPVSQICPVMWAAMDNRSVLQWDKEDCADAGLVKFDLLGLGMLTALRLCFEALADEGKRGRGGQILGLHCVPEDDPRTYDLLCAGDTVGVFQVESRAQMNTLPLLAPRCFYDIVIEVALIRPGPIQGHAVNPYLRRRQGREAITYPHPLLRPALEKTLGVPIFQEQLMRISIDAAGFSATQADQLRRAMGAKRSAERMEALKPALMNGMAERGIDEDTRNKIYNQLKGFADFGFPESHAFSFAHIVYASAWLKVHASKQFYAALLAAQPMGFYPAASLVQDARRHGVRVGGPDVQLSRQRAHAHRADSNNPPAPAPIAPVTLDCDENTIVRIGLDQIKGLGTAADRIVACRDTGGTFAGMADLASRASLSSRELQLLARAGALDRLGVSRREGIWASGALGQEQWHQPFCWEPKLVFALLRFVQCHRLKNCNLTMSLRL